MTAVVFVGAALRLWQLPTLPPGLWYDEAFNAMDVVWKLDNRVFPMYFVGNTGREPLFAYLGALSFGILGATPYTLRLVSAVVGILSIPILYRWVVSCFSGEPDRHWLGLTAAAVLSVSYWHVMMSRMGWRTILIPLFVVVTAHLFCRAWRSQSMVDFGLAGAALGVSQYTYTSARFMPLVFVILAVCWFFLRARQPSRSPGKSRSGSIDRQATPRPIVLGLLVMATVSAMVFLPLGSFFINNPSSFLARSGQVSVFKDLASGNLSLGKHILKAAVSYTHLTLPTILLV